MKMEVLGGKIRRNLISLNLRLRNNNSCFTLAPLGFKHCISSTSTLLSWSHICYCIIERLNLKASNINSTM